MAVDEEEEDENLVSTALEKWMKRMVQSGLKREPITPQPPPPPPTPRSTLKRASSSSTVPPKKKTTKLPTRTVSPKKTGPPPKKKKKSFMRGMLKESLLAGYKSVKPTPQARRRLDPAEGWEDWAEGRKLRRQLAGNDYWRSEGTAWISRNGSARADASGIG